MSTTASLKTLVDNWLTDVRRRGAELYAENQADESLYFSFEGKDQLRFGVRIDFVAHEITAHINSPALSYTKREVFILNEESLRTLAKQMCPLPEGQAISQSTSWPASRFFVTPISACWANTTANITFILQRTRYKR